MRARALRMRIVDYSALAGILQDEMGEESLEAVTAAIIGISYELGMEGELREERVLSILRESIVRLQDEIAIIHSPEMLEIPCIARAH